MCFEFITQYAPPYALRVTTVIWTVACNTHTAASRWSG